MSFVLLIIIFCVWGKKHDFELYRSPFSENILSFWISFDEYVSLLHFCNYMKYIFDTFNLNGLIFLMLHRTYITFLQQIKIKIFLYFPDLIFFFKS